MGNTAPPEVVEVIGFSPYIQALEDWESGLTVVWCYACSALSAVMDDRPSRTFRCGRLSCNSDLLKQPGHLSTLQPEKHDDTESAEVDSS